MMTRMSSQNKVPAVVAREGIAAIVAFRPQLKLATPAIVNVECDAA